MPRKISFHFRCDLDDNEGVNHVLIMQIWRAAEQAPPPPPHRAVHTEGGGVLAVFIL
jgi:hypothetical protein